MRICIIIAGGTITCAGKPLAPMPADRFAGAARQLLGPTLAATFPQLDLHFDDGLRFDSASGLLDSTDLRPGDWCRIARHILTGYADHDAFVVLHGTDTMDYSAAALPFLLNVFDPLGLGRAVLSKPVILTGAQLPLFRETSDDLVLNAGGDGFANLSGALACAALRIPEVSLFFDGKLWRGSRAIKVSTTRFAAFDSPHFQPLAEVGIGVWHGHAAPLPGPADPRLALDNPSARVIATAQLDAVEASIEQNPVVEIPATPADHGRQYPPLAAMIDAAVAQGARGILLTGYGEGNLPAGGGGIEAALRRADDAGVTTIVGSRVIGGKVGTFNYAAGAWIAGTGTIGAGDMTPIAAFAKFSVLSAAANHNGWDRAGLRRLMQRNLAGECTGQDRLVDGAVLRPGMALKSACGGASLDNGPDGLVLRTDDGRPVWSLDKPGRLIMRDAPAFVAPDGAVLWQSDVRLPGGVLILEGDTHPVLMLHDPAGRIAPLKVAPARD